MTLFKYMAYPAALGLAGVEGSGKGTREASPSTQLSERPGILEGPQGWFGGTWGGLWTL